MLDLMIDSGAYSVWKNGHCVELEEYADFLKRLSIPAVAVNLDVIPGRFGKAPTLQEVEESAQQGWKNACWLRKHGFDVLPVFHQGEDLSWLELMIAEGFDYIGISPANDRSVHSKRDWLDMVFSYITVDGWPVVKTHGFGMTSVELMRRYPWFSCDSTTWVLLAAFGAVMVPVRDESGYAFDQPPSLIRVSDRDSRSTNHWNFFQLGADQQQYIKQYVQDMGYSFEEVQRKNPARTSINLLYFSLFESMYRSSPFKGSCYSLLNFRRPNQVIRRKSPLKIDRIKFIFAENLSTVYGRLLWRHRIRNRLWSYAAAISKNSVSLDELHTYAQTDGRIFKEKDYDVED